MCLAFPATGANFVYFLNKIKKILSKGLDSDLYPPGKGHNRLAVVNGFHSRVLNITEQKDAKVHNLLAVEICGLIKPPADTKHMELRIEFTDITESDKPSDTEKNRGERPVYAAVKNYQAENLNRPTLFNKCGQCFVYFAELGKVPGADINLPNWTPIASIETDWLIFPRRGNRKLRLDATVVSKETGKEIICSKSAFEYENSKLGYFDMHEGISRAKTLAVALAFTVCTPEKDIDNEEIQVIREWAEKNVDTGGNTQKGTRKLKKALDQTIDFFRAGNQVDTSRICHEIRETTPPALHYEILELCMKVARAGGKVAQNRMSLLDKLAEWLNVDNDKYYSLREKIIPVNMIDCDDARTILGVTSDMDKDQAQKRLNEEYKKWSARVTSSDPAVKNQADQMLTIIAEARSEYLV